jgi:leucyl/phenylalanyl-tRNA--protein transferase
MFHVARDASKIALVHLVARLRAGGYRLLDTQYLTDHLKMFGTREISRARYQRELAKATREEADVATFAVTLSGADALRAAALSTNERLG